MMFDAVPMMAMAGPAPAPPMDGGSVATPTTTAVRKYFPETWIWDCQNSGFVPTLVLLALCVLSCVLVCVSLLRYLLPP